MLDYDTLARQMAHDVALYGAFVVESFWEYCYTRRQYKRLLRLARSMRLNGMVQRAVAARLRRGA